jgi:hypothetical protein
MKLLRSTWIAYCLSLIAVVLHFMTACDKKPRSTPDATQVKQCSEYNNKKDECNAARQNTGEQCEYDAADNKCKVKISAATVCKNLADDACKASKDCTFDATKLPKCTDADQAIKGKCEAIQEMSPCNSDTTCLWDSNKCKTKAGLSKKVTVYTLAKMNKGAVGANGGYAIANDNDIAGIAASGNGEYIYVVGDTNNTLNSLDVNTKTTANALGNFTLVRAAHNVAGAVLNFSGAPVSKWQPLSDGLLVWVTGKGVAQLVGTGVTNSFGWAKNVGNIKAGNADGLGEIIKGGASFLYMSVGVARNNVVFVQKNSTIATSYLSANWDNTLVKDLNSGAGPVPLTARYGQFLPGAHVLMVTEDGTKVDMIEMPNIGATNKGIIDNNNGVMPLPPHQGEINFIKENPAWRHGATANPVKKLGFSDKYLVAVFANTGAGTGGIALCDPIADDPKLATSWKWLDKSLDATDIIIDNHDATKRGKRALITTQTGFLILDGNTLVEPIPGQGVLINHSNTDRVAVETFAGATNGFAGVRLPNAAGGTQSYLGAAQDKNGLWYIAIMGHGAGDGGVFTLKIEEKTVTP